MNIKFTPTGGKHDHEQPATVTAKQRVYCQMISHKNLHTFQNFSN